MFLSTYLKVQIYKNAHYYVEYDGICVKLCFMFSENLELNKMFFLYEHFILNFKGENPEFLLIHTYA